MNKSRFQQVENEKEFPPKKWVPSLSSSSLSSSSLSYKEELFKLIAPSAPIKEPSKETKNEQDHNKS